MASFLLEPFFPFVLFLVHLLNCNQVLEHTFEDTKTPFFYSSSLKNNFLCHLFGLLFFRAGGSSLAWMGRPLFCSGVPLQLINVFKKKPFFSPLDRNHLKAWQRQRTNSVKHSKRIPCHHPYDACKGWRSWSVCAEQLCRIL